MFDNTIWFNQQLRLLRDEVLWTSERTFATILAAEDLSLSMWKDQAAHDYTNRHASLRRAVQADLLRLMHEMVNLYETIGSAVGRAERLAIDVGERVSEARLACDGVSMQVETARRRITDSQSHEFDAMQAVELAVAAIDQTLASLGQLSVPRSITGENDDIPPEVVTSSTSQPTAPLSTRSVSTGGSELKLLDRGERRLGVNKSELANTFSRLSGDTYENCLHLLDQEGAYDQIGNLRTSSLDRVAARLMVSNSALASELSDVTGRLFEDVLLAVESGRDPMRPTYRIAGGPQRQLPG